MPQILPTAASATLRGAAWMTCAAASWTVMTILVRDLSADYSAFELLFVRNLVAVSILLPPALRVGVASLKTKRLGLHSLRALFSYLAVLCLFFAISRLPLPDVTAVSFTQPLFVVVLAALILKEIVGAARWRAVAFGLVGLLIIVRPGFSAIGLATVAVLVSAISYSCANICVKRLMTTDTPNQSVVYFNLLMLPLSFVPALFFWTTPDLADAARMIGIGLAGTLTVYAFARAFAVADASAVMPFDFLRLPFAAFAAFFLFGESGDAWTWAGSLVIFASSYALARIEGTPGSRKKPGNPPR
jgi:drug/metabolite transporter (DMT)-like permease